MLCKGSSGRKRGRRICTRGGGRKRRKRHHERRSTLARPRAGSVDVSERLVGRLCHSRGPLPGRQEPKHTVPIFQKKTPSNSGRLVWSKPSDQAIQSSPSIPPDMEQVSSSDSFLSPSRQRLKETPTKLKVATAIVAVSKTIAKESRLAIVRTARQTRVRDECNLTSPTRHICTGTTQ